MGRITITSRSAPQLGRTRADFRDDWTLPATFYDLSGPRISGTVTVWAEAEPAFDQPPVLEDCEVRILLGGVDPHRRHYNFVERGALDRPLTVNGVAIARHQTGTHFRPLLLADADRCGGFLSWNLPERTRESTTALLRFVALHWVRRDPEYLVHCISATARGLGRWQAERRKRMTRLHHAILDDYQVLERLRAVGYDAHLYRLAPPPGPRPETAERVGGDDAHSLPTTRKTPAEHTARRAFPHPQKRTLPHMERDIIATEPDGVNWLATGTVWDRDAAIHEAVAIAAAQIRWHSVSERPSAAASRRLLTLAFFESGFIAATGASEPTLWLPRAKPYRTKPVPFTLTGIRELTAKGTRALLLLTDDRGSVPIALTERHFSTPNLKSPCRTAHDSCPGQEAEGRACPCRCGCQWPDRLTVYERLVVGDEATDLAWQWPFTVTGTPEATEHGNLALEVQGRDERSPDLLCRGPDEPVIVHNTWRTNRTGTAPTEPPSST